MPQINIYIESKDICISFTHNGMSKQIASHHQPFFFNLHLNHMHTYLNDQTRELTCNGCYQFAFERHTFASHTQRINFGTKFNHPYRGFHTNHMAFRWLTLWTNQLNPS